MAAARLFSAIEDFSLTSTICSFLANSSIFFSESSSLIFSWAILSSRKTFAEALA